MRMSIVVSLITLFTLLCVSNVYSQREKMSFDNSWKFAYGHPYDTSKDFNHGTGYFSYFAKAGNGDGPAALHFDDRAWRILDLPHDWAVGQPFDSKGSHSHGYKAIGRNFPDVSVGWYRKEFFIPESDLGKRISVTFDGVCRDAKVWVNGFYLGNEPSGYCSFTYDITEYLNYNGSNVISVRADVTMEEGWFYEGAGIYRHVWLSKTNPLHVAQYGTFVYSEIDGNNANVKIETTITNDSREVAVFAVKQQLFDGSEKLLAETKSGQIKLAGGDELTEKQLLTVDNPHLWSIDDPYLHKVVTIIEKDGIIVDQYETSTGIRTIRLDANEGFFLNGKHVKLKGTNNHQDHAGVGAAIPDELNYFRISQLKAMGSNAYRCSHNPATPELLDACDRLGMVVIDENRLMGTTSYVKDQLKSMIVRDRNHPSIFVWSLGNEEWKIEGNITGDRIIQNMQTYAKKLDPTRMMNCASSGGWGQGVSKNIEVAGFNYLEHGNMDDYHRDFPNTPSMGTEEGSTHATRGVYFDNPERQHLVAYDRMTSNTLFQTIEYCWKYYDSRPYLAGMFIWTGLDYRGEPTPYGWPSINSYFGMYDVCGFPKDNVWYLKSWWGSEPVLHLLPHWNWKGKEGEPIKVVAYSNCDEVELFLNNKSLGKKTMEKNSHLEWMVPYKAGSLKAIAYKQGKKILTETVETTSEAVAVKLTSHKTGIKADGKDLAIITASVVDQKGREVPNAENLVEFDISGPGKIIGVGNGDPTCLEADKYIDEVHLMKSSDMKMKPIDNFENRAEVAVGLDDSGWMPAFSQKLKEAKTIVYRSTFELPQDFGKGKVMLFLRTIGQKQLVYLNGKQIGEEMNQKTDRYTIQPDVALLKPGKNELTFVCTPYFLAQVWDEPNTDAGVIQLVMPAPQWKRSLFSGKAQVIVQAGNEAGQIKLTARSAGLTSVELSIEVE